MGTFFSLSDVINLDVLQSLQDNLAQAMGLSFSTVDYKGNTVTKPSNFQGFCLRGRQRPEFAKLCAQCDAHGGLHSAITESPYIYRCHAGLVSFAVPLVLGNSYIGAVLGGQVQQPPDETHHLEFIIPQRIPWQEDPELAALYTAMPSAPYTRIEASVALLRDMIQYTLEEGYDSKIEELLQNKDTKEAEEKDLLKEEIPEVEPPIFGTTIGFDFFFQLLNILAKMAYLEKAPQTEEMLCDFADMMRYVMSRKKASTLGEEMDFLERLLRIQKAQMEENFYYTIAVPPQYRDTLCPFMVMQPIIENSLKHAFLSKEEAGHVSVSARQEGELLLVSIRDNGPGITVESVEAILDPSGFQLEQEGRVGLSGTNRKLKAYFGRKYGLEIKSAQDEIEGTEIIVRLPLTDRPIS